MVFAVEGVWGSEVRGLSLIGFSLHSIQGFAGLPQNPKP